MIAKCSRYPRNMMNVRLEGAETEWETAWAER